MQIQPYLYFEGRCEEAIEFYRTVWGAELVSLHRYKDGPQSVGSDPDSGNKIMHATLRIGESEILVSDGHCTGQAKFQGFSLMLNLNNEADAKKAFAALGEGG